MYMNVTVTTGFGINLILLLLRPVNYNIKYIDLLLVKLYCTSMYYNDVCVKTLRRLSLLCFGLSILIDFKKETFKNVSFI